MRWERRSKSGVLAVVCLAGVAAPGGRAEGATPQGGDAFCPVSVAPPDAPSSWVEAARVAQDRLRLVAPRSDCRAIGIEVEGDRALVSFTTRDGRRAVRPLRSPDEIGPLVEALLVTLADDTPTPAVAESPISSATASSVEGQPPPAGGAPDRTVLLFGGGGLVGSPGLASPSIGAGVGTLVGAWELSGFGRWEPSYVLVNRGAWPSFSMSRCTVGLTAGRRAQLGGASFALGLRAGVAVTSEDGSDPSGPSSGGGSGSSSGSGGPSRGGPGGGAEGAASTPEPLAGAYVGFVFPRRAAVRVRPELSVEAVASRVGRTLRLDPSLPSVPWWGASASIGLEWEVP